MAPALDPAVERLLERQRAATVPPLDAMSVEGMRRQFAAWNRPDGCPEVGRTTDISIPGPDGALSLRAYVPKVDGPHPILVYFHGGGWVIGDLDTHDGICRALTNTVGCLTLAVDYRRAPESPFPAAVADARAAVAWTVAHGDSLGGDTDRVAVGGDSAGGTLATVASLLARDDNRLDLVAQVLAYPVTNYARELDSYAEGAEYSPSEDPNWFKEYYLASPLDGHNPLAFPLQARDLGGLPPALIVTGEFDPLRDDGLAYRDRLEAAGIRTEHRHFDGMIHGFLHYDDLDARREAIRTIGEFLGHRFAR